MPYIPPNHYIKTYTTLTHTLTHPQGKGNTTASSSSSEGPSDIKAKILEIVAHQDILKQRMAAIHERSLAQQERVALIHGGALRTRSAPLSQKEREFRAELEEWHNMVR